MIKSRYGKTIFVNKIMILRVKNAMGSRKIIFIKKFEMILGLNFLIKELKLFLIQGRRWHNTPQCLFAGHYLDYCSSINSSINFETNRMFLSVHLESSLAISSLIYSLEE